MENINTKHLARNIPEDFVECCERIRLRLFTSMLGRRQRPPDFSRTYGAMFDLLSEDGLDEDTQRRIGLDLDEIQIRFLAIQMTLDKSVPAKPVFDSLSMLNRNLIRVISKLDDPDRDRYVAGITDEQQSGPIEQLSTRLDNTSSLAEKVTTVRRHLQELSRDLEPAIEFFDYKRGLVTKGNPSKYAMIYAVLALAELFEKENSDGKNASINESQDYGRNGKRGDHHNRRRYTGKFLDLVTRFYFQVVPEQISNRSNEVFPEQTTNRANEGFPDQVRKILKRRRIDPKAHLLLHGEVPVKAILEFMSRADAIK